MKKEDFFEAVGDVDAYAVSAAHAKRKKTVWLKWTALAASFCLVIGGIMLYKAENPYPVREMPGGTTNTDSEIAMIEHWEDLPIYRQYMTLYVGDTKYAVRNGTVTDADISEKLCDTVVFGWDEYAEFDGEDGSKQHDAEIFALNGVARECGVAVRYAGTDEYYTAMNWMYRPETLGQFMDDLDMRKNVVFSEVWREYNKPISGDFALVRFDNVDTARIWDMLTSAPDAENVYDEADPVYHESAIDVSVDVPIFGYENVSLEVCEDGYVKTNIFETGKLFYIGEDRTQPLIDYVLNECDGYEIKLSTTTTSIPE